MTASENVPPNAPMRPCWRCRKCQALQSRIETVGNEYDSIREYLLKDAKRQPQQGACAPIDDELREQVTQLRITIDTIVRSQLFEILDS
ncbi:unnamed protein product [Chondrus crispus]|uniref:Uncharacterized protein n=1 Tax=Chondrus crispus TaxID=2769 RepID=R7Q6S9_CHOCR|nr:unnamed protein product [Chondrus crispus]CDF34247.1 unnamed protein product [Chondrus crispus]|eukprot:XP_005714066.1 unnamed protein product [Chondrus crispus]